MEDKGGRQMSRIRGFFRRLWPFRKKEEIAETKNEK